jgi:hypothetical protein
MEQGTARVDGDLNTRAGVAASGQPYLAMAASSRDTTPTKGQENYRIVLALMEKSPQVPFDSAIKGHTHYKDLSLHRRNTIRHHPPIPGDKSCMVCWNSGTLNR